MRRNVTIILRVTAALAIALLLKYHYSTASVNDLKWILAPSTLAVELLTGIDFNFESQSGYLSADKRFLIAGSCSGVNFLIIAFLVLALGRIRRDENVGWSSIPIAMLIAYATTIVANTTRIIVAIFLGGLEYPVLRMSFGELHRIEGIIVYFGFLLLLFLVSGRSSENLLDTVLSRSKYLLAIYYGVTLGVPLVRGAYVEREFWRHSIVVVLIPLLLILPFILFRLVRERSALRVKLP